MNGGHSTVAMLESNPSLEVHSFDLLMWNYSRPVVEILRARYGHRFHLHEGDSRVQVPVWVQEEKPSCDLLFVDGDHSTQGT